MKVITKSHIWTTNGNGAYQGELMTTKACKFYSGYRGRGIPEASEVLPAGTKMNYCLRSNGSDTQSWLQVWIDRPNDKYGEVVLKMELTFDIGVNEANRKYLIWR